MGLVDTLPDVGVRPVLFLPFWLGSLRDESGYGNHVDTIVQPQRWSEGNPADGIVSSSTGYLGVPADSSLEITAQTLFVVTSIIGQKTNEYMIKNNGGPPWFYRNATAMVYYDGSVASVCTANTVGAKTLAVTAGATPAKPQFYVDRSSCGPGSVDVTGSAASAQWRLLGFAGNNGHQSPCQAVIAWPAVLTADQVYAAYDWAEALITPRKGWPAQGLDYAGATFIGEPTYVDNIQSARVSLADETAGRLSNTGLSILLGTWRVVEDSSGRKISCVADGKLRRKLTGADTYTTARFDSTGGVVLTKAAGYIELTATVGDTISALVLTAP